MDLSVLRAFRLLRLLRIARLLRMVHLIHDLRMIATAMASAFSALIWTMTLLIFLVYIWSILCMEFIARAQHKHRSVHHAELKYYFGSLGRSMLTMFESIVGGISWDEAANPLVQDVGPFMGVAIVVYIVITCYAVTNMMTGMFVQKAMQIAEETKDRDQANLLKDFCFKPDEVTGKIEEISWAKFEAMSRCPEMIEYFKVLNVEPSEAEDLFHLLDRDGGGMLDPAELVSGCLRLRGPAKCLDMCMLMREVSAIKDMVQQTQATCS